MSVHDTSRPGFRLIDERDAVTIIDDPCFRVVFIDGTNHETYAVEGSLEEVQSWVAESGRRGRHVIYAEVPIEAEPGNVTLVRVADGAPPRSAG